MHECKWQGAGLYHPVIGGRVVASIGVQLGNADTAATMTHQFKNHVREFEAWELARGDMRQTHESFAPRSRCGVEDTLTASIAVSAGEGWAVRIEPLSGKTRRGHDRGRR